MVDTIETADSEYEKMEYLVSLRYFVPAEVVVHNTPDDCWVSFLGYVWNLTPLIKRHLSARETQPILAHAGKDISHWFNERTGEIRHYVHPVTGVVVPYTPHGPVRYVGLQVPSMLWLSLGRIPWWTDPQFVIGRLTKNARPLRIMNVLSGQEVTITVCEEESINDIQERYKPFNKHAGSYTWKFEGQEVDMNLTLDKNGIPDVRKRLLSLGLNEDIYTPCMQLYYNDDLT